MSNPSGSTSSPPATVDPGPPMLPGADPFSIGDNATFTQVHGNQHVTNLTTENRQTETKFRKEIAAWLTSIDFKTIHDHNLGKRSHGTGWILENESFQKWVWEDRSRPLWIRGMPGAGKTILTSIIINYLQSLSSFAGHKPIVLFAYFQYDRPRTVHDILSSLLRQLVESAPESLPQIQSVYKTCKASNQRLSQKKIAELLHSILPTLKARTFIVLDALDELVEEERDILLDIVASFPANLILTSHPFESLAGLSSPVILSFEDNNNTDIDSFIHTSVQQSQRLKTFICQNPGLEQEILLTLREKAQGMFLVVALQMEELKHAESVKNLRQILQSLPSDVNAMYEITLQRIKAQPKAKEALARRILTWVTYAQHPLRLREIQDILAISPKTGTFNRKDIPSKEAILSVCCGLVTVEELDEQGLVCKEGLVRLLHYTTIDFVRSTIDRICPNPHTMLTKDCLTYLTAMNFHQQCSGEFFKNFGGYISDKPFLKYAHNNWGRHAAAEMSSAADGLAMAVWTFLK